MRPIFLLLFSLVFSSMLNAQDQQLISRLEVFDIESDKRKVLYEAKAHFEAPNWSRAGDYLLINQGGGLYRFYFEADSLQPLDTDFADRCNNDHGFSPDGQQLVISHNDPTVQTDGANSRIFILPVDGGVPKLITPLAPSYWHGWSPDGQTLAYVANREGDYNIYAISVEGGEETQLTDSPGLDDGPDYSPDGRHIYYNSMASGKMELWRMHADGSEPEQLTDDAYSNWFPHPSPDGRYLVYISYLEDQGSQHPPMKDVVLRLYDLESKEIRTLCQFTGGQGTINVPSWSPDSKRFAFVTYEAVD
ncbi:MAG: transporter [Bacteroidota bacterium]